MQICKLKKKKKKAASFDAFHQPHSEIFLHGVQFYKQALRHNFMQHNSKSKIHIKMYCTTANKIFA